MTAVTDRLIKSVSYSLQVHCLQPPADSRCIAPLSRYPQHDGLAIVATTVLLTLPRATPCISPLSVCCLRTLPPISSWLCHQERRIPGTLFSTWLPALRFQDLLGLATPRQTDCSLDWSLCAIAHANRVKFTIFDTHTYIMTALIRQSPIRELFDGIVMPTDWQATAAISAVTVAKAHAVRCWTAAQLGHRSAAVEPQKTP